MTINEIINHLSSNTLHLQKPKDQDTLLLEHFEDFQQNFSIHCYYIDRFPVVVESFDAYSQLEVYFDAVEQMKLSLELYQQEEQKLINVVKKLFVYNSPVFVETLLGDVDLEDQEFLKPNELNRLRELQQEVKYSGGFLNLSKVNDLELFIKLGLRERVSSVLYLSNFKTIIWITSGLVIPAYIHDSKNKGLLQMICTTEGVYLRPSS